MKCGVPTCVAIADEQHPSNARPRGFFGPFCVVHITMGHTDLAEAMSRKVGLVPPLEAICAGTIEYELKDGRRYVLNKDGSPKWTA
jgi:hypothetical protein